ncbi:MAG: hypothetical protein ACYTG7_16330 [Planctomycetota bacterium]|jgi:hypothetical protein
MKLKFSRQMIILVMLTLFAFYVRARHLGMQILGGDELHLLKIITTHSFADILGFVTQADFSIPLALLAKSVSSLIPLSEIELRLLFLLLGSIAPVVFVLGARRFVSPATAFLFGVIVAAHPFFIFYGRFVRPYGLCVILIFLVLVFLDTWRDSNKGKYLVGAILIAAAANWIHLLSLITTGCIFLGMIVRILCERKTIAAPSGGATARKGRFAGTPVVLCATAGAACLLFTVLLYIPAIEGLNRVIFESNIGQGRIKPEVLWRNAAVLAGFPGRGMALVLLFLSHLGVIVLMIRKPARALFLLIPALVQPVLILVLKPHLSEFSFVLARYVFFVLPLWILFACVGFQFLFHLVGREAWRARRDYLLPVASAILAAAWLILGPYFEIYHSANAYAHHNVFQDFSFRTDPRMKVENEKGMEVDIPAFYHSIEEDTVILEGPAPEGFVDNILPFYQYYHRCPMKLITTDDTFWGSACFDFDNVIVLRQDETPSFHGADIAIIHKKIRLEVLRILGRPPRSGQTLAASRKQIVSALSSRLEKICGPPIHDSDLIRVFRLPRPNQEPE